MDLNRGVCKKCTTFIKKKKNSSFKIGFQMRDSMFEISIDWALTFFLLLFIIRKKRSGSKDSIIVWEESGYHKKKRTKEQSNVWNLIEFK